MGGTLESQNLKYQSTQLSFKYKIAEQTCNQISSIFLHRKKFTTGLVELAAVMATNKVSKKRQKLFQISYKKNA
jgi:hypothetical protein